MAPDFPVDAFRAGTFTAFFGAVLPAAFLVEVFFAAVRPPDAALRAGALAAGFRVATFFVVLPDAFFTDDFFEDFAADLRAGLFAPAFVRDEPPPDFGGFVFFLAPDPVLELRAPDFAAVRDDCVTDLACFRGCAFPLFGLLAFFALGFGLAFPAMVTSWA